MADDDRTRRRLGDETKSRIADLASGWSVDSPPSEPAAAPDVTEPPRKKQRTIPPPAPGSPERQAFEQTIVAASGADRDDATDVLPPKRPTGGQPIVATSADRDDATDVLPPKRPTGGQPIVATDATNSVPPKHTTGAQPIVATTRAREDVTEELLDIETCSVPVAPARRESRADARRPDDPRATQPSTPQPIVGARTKASTGQVRTAGDEPPVGARTRGATGPQSIIPNIPMRAKSSTAPQPAVSRPRAATGQHTIIPTRSQTPSGQQPVVTRAHPGTGPQPFAHRANAPSGSHGVVAAPADPSGTQPHSGVPGPATTTGPRPVPLATPRTKSASLPPPPPGSPARLAAERSKPASAPPPTGERGSAFSTQPFGSPDRSKPASSAPPPPPALRDRSKPGWQVPPAASEHDETSSLPPPPIERSKPASVPPPTAIAVPPLVMSTSAIAAAPATEPGASSGPHYPRATYDGPVVPFSTESRTFSTEPRTPAVIVDASLEDEPRMVSASVKQTVPTGEFDSGVRTIQDKTNPRDIAEALLSIPQAETPVEDLLDDDDDDDGEVVDVNDEDDDGDAGQRPLHAAPDPATEKFERGDPTQDAPPGTPDRDYVRSKYPTGGTLRASAALRRKRGRWGDVRYVSTAVFGVRRARRELVELEHRQGLRQTSRRRHLITLGRTAAVMDNFDHPALGKAREQLASIEDERSKHAGAVAASDAELERVRRDRDNSARQYAIAMSEADAELAELAAKLEPVEKEAVSARKRAADLREELQRIEKQIADAEASLVSPKAEKNDRAAVQADVATFKANKVAVQRDEPVIATELDALNPRIAAMEATRAGLEKKKTELQKAEQEDQRRTLELLEAIGAKRKVVERAAADAEAARDNALFDLGERLYVERPSILTAQLSPIDQIDLELGEGERRAMELKEILSNIDKAKFARGLAIIILAAGAGASLAYLVVSAVV